MVAIVKITEGKASELKEIRDMFFSKNAELVK